MPQEWLTSGQTAQLLGVSRSTATRYAEQGLLETRRLPSGHLRISRASAERLLRQIEDDERKR